MQGRRVSKKCVGSAVEPWSGFCARFLGKSGAAALLTWAASHGLVVHVSTCMITRYPALAHLWPNTRITAEAFAGRKPS